MSYQFCLPDLTSLNWMTCGRRPPPGLTCWFWRPIPVPAQMSPSLPLDSLSSPRHPAALDTNPAVSWEILGIGFDLPSFNKSQVEDSVLHNVFLQTHTSTFHPQAMKTYPPHPKHPDCDEMAPTCNRSLRFWHFMAWLPIGWVVDLTPGTGEADQNDHCPWGTSSEAAHRRPEATYLQPDRH